MSDRTLKPRAMLVALLAAAATAFLWPLPAHAWGAEGHRLIARFAAAQLTPAARREVAALLALPGDDLEAVSDGLADVSTWADEVRSPSTAPWHYVNYRRAAADQGDQAGAAAPRHCGYDPSQQCIDGVCVVSAVRRQARALATPAPDADRARALRYLVHFVADVHQPLHSGFADDRGGNSYQVQAFGRGSNLHAVWDSGLIAAWPGGTDALRADMASARPPAGADLDPESWSGESCVVVSSVGFYPDGRRVGREYLEQWGATLVERLSAAGWRLAGLLNGLPASR